MWSEAKKISGQQIKAPDLTQKIIGGSASFHMQSGWTLPRFRSMGI